MKFTHRKRHGKKPASKRSKPEKHKCDSCEEKNTLLNLTKCDVCDSLYCDKFDCDKCVVHCIPCKRVFCVMESDYGEDFKAVECTKCNIVLCDDCIKTCQKCQAQYCNSHLFKNWDICESCHATFYEDNVKDKMLNHIDSMYDTIDDLRKKLKKTQVENNKLRMSSMSMMAELDKYKVVKNE